MFSDRSRAGRLVAARLADYDRPRPLVLGLPRGGLPVALEVAVALDADLDVMVVRKLGAPGNPEFAMGAVGEGGVLIIDHATRRLVRATSDQVEMTAAAERGEIDRRVQTYRGGRAALGIAGRNVIIVDDGMATGSTAAAGVAVVKNLGAAHVTLAVPVGSAEAVTWLGAMVDDLVCLETPASFRSVSESYQTFNQIDDEQVVAILRAHPRRDVAGDAVRMCVDENVTVTFDELNLAGHLTIPTGAGGIVLFAHGSGSGWHSPRNGAVAKVLNGAGLGTLLLDLLTADEADVRRNVLDIEMLAGRLSHATRWLRDRPDVDGLPLGYFGASTGAATALVAAARKPNDVMAVVSRGGRPDLAGDWLTKVQVPTLLIVGANDLPVIDLNREAQRQLTCPNLLEIVRGATHLFEEPGTLAQAARLAQSWFLNYLR
ncbi:MAG: phosphoribosyltransferase family protein [Actinobacteria bacterium]|nr:phosphoribosyltransferase family protein [Actinomycetota bacterium]